MGLLPPINEVGRKLLVVVCGKMLDAESEDTQIRIKMK